MYPLRLRTAQQLSRQCARSFTTSGRQLYSSSTVPAPEKKDGEKTVEITPTEPAAVVKQAPNRAEIWSRSQKPRSEAMTGPRFEQTNFDLQVSYGLLSRNGSLCNRNSQTNIRDKTRYTNILKLLLTQVAKYSLNHGPPWSSSTSSLSSGCTSVLSHAMVVVALPVIPKFTSTPTSLRLPPATTVDFLS